MRLTRVLLQNWKNFTAAGAELQERVFIVGPNASGKSNFLDALRFLRDVADPEGGLQRAVAVRGGFGSLRSLSATRNAEVGIEIAVGGGSQRWGYELSLIEQDGRAAVSREVVTLDGREVRKRPYAADKVDPALLAQTHLEQVAVNEGFRQLGNFLAQLDYLHVAPEFVRQRARITAIKNDPYGSDFLERVAATPEATLREQMKRLNAALRIAVPELDGIEVDVSGRAPHLRVRFRNWRPTALAQDENEQSDGTLRLFAFLWSLMDGTGPLLLEEPELSLHPGVVRNLVSVCSTLTGDSGRQLFISTHSLDLLSDESIAPEEVLMLLPTKEGTEIRVASDDEQIRALLEGGLTMGDAVLPATNPPDSSLLPIAGRAS
jgi:predicted ATPase